MNSVANTNPLTQRPKVRNLSQYCQAINLATLVLLGCFAFFLLWVYQLRFNEFERTLTQQAQLRSTTAAGEIERAIAERVRFIGQYVADNRPAFVDLLQHLDDPSRIEQAERKLRLYFPDLFAMNIADRSAKPLFDDFDGRIEAVCLADMRQFISSRVRDIRVHPNPVRYHYDLLFDFEVDGRKYLLFFSFGLEEFATILGLARNLWQDMLLVSPTERGHLIEVTAGGARNVILDRESMYLSAEEMQRILGTAPVTHANWITLALVKPGYIASHHRSLLIEAVGIYAVFLSLVLLMRYFMLKTEQSRVRAENKLKERNQQIVQLNEELVAANEQLSHSALTDSLTELRNRRHFDLRLSDEINRARRQRYCLSLFLFDIDYFKQYNDTYGHETGDRCLQAIACQAKQCFRRAEDFVARYGGEEFVVLMSGPDARQAGESVHHFIQTVERLNIQHTGSAVSSRVTFSGGLVTLEAEQLGRPEAIVNLADQLLYEAKGAGRNQVRVQAPGGRRARLNAFGAVG